MSTPPTTRSSMSDRDRAMLRVLGVLRSRLACYSPAFGDALRDVALFNITAEELLTFAKSEG